MKLRSVFSPSRVRAVAFRLEEAVRGRSNDTDRIETHVKGAVEWILRAQAATPDDGVAESYKVLSDEWRPSYPETTGYIICSLLRVADSGIGDADRLREASRRMGLWLVGTQLPEGAFFGGNVGIKERRPAVFNTGQILKGMTDLIGQGLDGDGAMAASAKRAVDWLIEGQDEDGAWRRGISVLTTEPIHSYNVRTAWALARYGARMGLTEAVEAGVRNGEWVLSVRDEAGWFAHMNFDVGVPPWTHTVAYTIRGLLELGMLCDRSDFIEAAEFAAERMRRLQDSETGAVPGQIQPGYRAEVKWTNTTANSQLAVIWWRLAALTGEKKWREAAAKANQFNRSLQELGHRNPGRRGGLRGAYPGHQGYGRYWYMNWTQKFYIDALLAEAGVELQ